MTVIRVMPRVAESESARRDEVQDSRLNPELEIGAKPRQDRSGTVESKQNSVEIAFMTCDVSEALELSKQEHQDIYVEMEPSVVEPSDDLSSLMQHENISTIVPSERSAGPVRVENENDHRETEKVRKMEKSAREKMLSHRTERDRKRKGAKTRNCGDCEADVQEEKCSSWWKDGGQTVLQFFARMLGKRCETGAKGATTDRVLSIGKRVKRVSRGDRSRNRRDWGDVDGGIRLKRVGNGYIANHARRNESRRKSAAKNKSREEQRQRQQQQHHPSILVRQIQQTRDKNLRVALMERELRARLAEREPDVRLTANANVNVRQLSSPLC